jgi:integrase
MSILCECPQCHKKIAVKNKRCKCGADMDRLKRGRKVRYWVNYLLPGGRQKREAVSGEGINPYSIEDAKKFHSKRVVQRVEKKVFEIQPDAKMTFQQLTDWYLGLAKVQALASYGTIKTYLGKFNSEFGNRIVASIKQVDLEDLQAKRQGEGLKPKTIDDEINYAKTMVFKARKNKLVGIEILEAFQDTKPLLKKNSNARDRVLTVEEFEKLLLYAPNHLKGILVMGYWTGMRKGEIRDLVWSKVAMKERVIRLAAEDVKEGTAKTIPIGTEVYKMLKSLPVHLHKPNVFLYNGRPIKRNFSTGLKTACKEAGIQWGREEKDGFIFHDIRHTFVTDCRKAGVSKSVRMSITGHAPKDMDDRYNRVDIQDQQDAIQKLEKYRTLTKSLTKRVSEAAN